MYSVTAQAIETPSKVLVAADLVQNYQRPCRGVVEDVRGLVHFHHEGAAAPRQFVRRADTGEYPVHDADPRLLCRDEPAHLRHEHHQRDLPDVRGFPRHVRAGDEQEPLLAAIQKDVVGDELLLQHLLQNRMAAVLDAQHRLLVHDRRAVAVLERRQSQRRQHVYYRHRVSHLQ
jgi:hypothetical protein